MESLPIPIPCKTAATHAFFLQNHISRLQLFNNLIRPGFFFCQLTFPGNELFFERILKLEIKHLTCIFVEYDLILIPSLLLYKRIKSIIVTNNEASQLRNEIISIIQF